MPVAVTSTAEAVRQVDRGLMASRKRRAAILSAINASGRNVDPDIVERIGGEKLAIARRRLAAAQSEHEGVVAHRARVQRRLSWLPFFMALSEGSFRKSLEAKQAAVETAKQRNLDLEARIRGLVQKRRIAAAELKFADELYQLAAADEWLNELAGRLRSLDRDGIHNLGLEPPVAAGSRGWLRKLDLLLRSETEEGSTGEVSVINDGLDHSKLDLRWRSKAAPMLRNALSLEDCAWLESAGDERPVLRAENRLPGALAGFKLTGRAPVPVPGHLFAPRERRAVPLLPGGTNRLDRVSLPAPVDMVAEIAEAGAQVGRRGVFHIDPSQVDCGGSISRFLPFIAQRWYAPLPIELIPSSSWGASLANLLQPASWNEIRMSVTERYGGLCQVCGQLKQGSSIECHEIWDYDADQKVDGMHIQRLAGMMSVCKSCHLSMHLGFSKMRGHEDTAAYRLADINGWSMAEFEQAEEWMWANYEIRSRVRWALDLSLVAAGKPLVVDKSKWRLTATGDLLPVDPGERRSMTRLYGVDFRIGAKGEAYPARAPRSGVPAG